LQSSGRSSAPAIPFDTDAIVSRVGDEFDSATVRRALELLEQDGWLEAELELGAEGPISVAPKPRALQLLRGWPTDAGEAAIVRGLLDALDEAIANTSDPEEKTRLQKLRGAAGDVGKSVLAGAILTVGKTVVGG